MHLSKKTAGETSGVEHVDGEFAYHGKIGVRLFTCWHGYKASNPQFHVAEWTPAVDTFEEPEVFCGNQELVQTNRDGNRIYKCRGHALDAIVAITDRPIAQGAQSEPVPIRPPRSRSS